MALVDSSGKAVKSGTGGTVNSSGGGGGGGGNARANRAAERKRIKEAKATKAKSAERLAAARAGAAEDAKIEAETKRTADKIAKETAKSNAAAKEAKDLAAKQAKDKVDAKAKADKIAEDKKEYDKGIALAAKKAKVKRDNAAKAAKDQAAAKAKRDMQAKIAKAEKAQAAKDAKAKALETAGRGDLPLGSPLQGSPHERNVDSVERMLTNDGLGMEGAGQAYYPTDKGETLEDNIPSSMLGKLGSVLNPTKGIINTAGKTFLNQVKYGMNEEASNLYQELIQDPANADKTTKELVEMARKPQMDNQLDHAYINNGTVNTANAKQLDNMRPKGISDKQWDSMPIALKRILTSKAPQANTGMLTGEAEAPEDATAPVTPTLGQLTTGEYTPTERPDWAPQASIFDNIMPPTQQPSFAPQWNPNAAAPSWAPQARSMLGAPMQLQAPPSRFLK